MRSIHVLNETVKAETILETKSEIPSEESGWAAGWSKLVDWEEGISEADDEAVFDTLAFLGAMVLI